MSLTLRDMTDSECRALLTDARFGHLACCKDGRPYVVPIYFVFDHSTVYSFTMPGKKLDWMRQNPHVCLQVDEQGADEGWGSVVAEGRFEEYTDTDGSHAQLIHAWTELQRYPDWWEIGALKPRDLPVASASPHVFYGITVTDIHGRRARAAD